MGIHIDLSLDADGHHTFAWRISNEPGALDIAPATLQRWEREHKNFRAASARWDAVVDEIDDVLLAGLGEQRRKHSG